MTRGSRLLYPTDERGVALVAVLLLSVILIPLAILASITANVELTAESNKMRGDQSFSLADAGLAVGIDWLFKQDPPPQPNDGAAIDLGTDSLGTGGTYQVTVDPDDANDYTGDDPWLYTLTSTGSSAHGGTRTVSQIIEIEPLRMGDFLYLFMNMSSGEFYRDSLIGRTYVRRDPDIRKPSGHPDFPNGPVFTKTLWTHSDSMDVYFDDGGSFPNTADPDVINAAAEFWKRYFMGAPEIDLRLFNADGVRNRAAETGLWLVGPTDIVMMGNILRITDRTGTHLHALTGEALFIWTTGKTSVKGVLDGVLVVGSSKSIIQADDIVYAEDPRVVPDSDDMLILVTEGTYDYANDLADRPVVRTMARILVLEQGTFNTSAGAAAAENWWDFFGSLACEGYTVSKPRRNGRLQWDWREVPAGIPNLNQIVFYDRREHGQSWVEHYK